MMNAACIEGVYGIVDADEESDLLDIADAYLSCGARVLQLRMKNKPTRQLINLAHELRDKCRQAAVTFIVNDRADVAALVDADGVHLGQSDLPIAAARALLPNGIIGKSTHNERQIWLAHAEGADYVGFGPVFKTNTKRNAEPVVGIKALQDAVRNSPIPVVAIGGVQIDNIKQVVATGCAAAATVSAVSRAWQPTDAVRSLVRAFTLQKKAPNAPLEGLKNPVFGKR